MNIGSSRRRRVIGIAIFVLWLATAPITLAGNASDSGVFVSDGRAKALDDFALGKQTPREEYLAVASMSKDEAARFRQHTCSTLILAAPAIDYGDFHVSAKLCLVRKDQTTNPLLLSFKLGTHYYDFQLEHGSISYAGRMLDAVKYESAEHSQAAKLPADQTPYVLRIQRANGKVAVSCDGTPLTTLDAVSFLHGDIAIEVSSPQAEKTLQENATGETELRIYDFRATGALPERTPDEQQWRQRILPEYRQVRRIGNAMGYVADDPNLPRMLLIGDSISLYYTDPVRKLLNGRANVHRIPDNARMTSYGLEQMDKWLNGEKWDIIHFNFGLHDITRTSPEDYEKNLEQLVNILQRSGKRLMFASTTPVPPETKLITPALVDKYNTIARRVMDWHSIPIDDLHAWMLPHVDQYKLFPGNEHFKSEGSTYLATKVSQAISHELDQRR